MGSYYIVGLGNPGPEYSGTRHNAGRFMVESFQKNPPEKGKFSEFEFEKKVASVSLGKLGGNNVTLILPEGYMNNSGKSLAGLVRPKKEMPHVIVVHDDIDLPLGKFKIVFNRGAGGHRGVMSVRRALKTDAFVRVRVGICPRKKPNHKELLDFLTSKFRKPEEQVLKKISKKIREALGKTVLEGHEKAMNVYNTL